MGCVFPDGSGTLHQNFLQLPQLDYLPSGGFCLRVASSHAAVDVHLGMLC